MTMDATVARLEWLERALFKRLDRLMESDPVHDDCTELILEQIAFVQMCLMGLKGQAAVSYGEGGMTRMGVSTDAIVFWGYCWSEETELFDFRAEFGDRDIEWPEAILRRRGKSNPWDNAPADLDRYLPGERYEQKEARVKAWTDANRAALDEWYKAGRDIEEEFGIELRFHCSDECSMPYLTLATARHLSHRGYPQELDPAALVPAPDWAAKLDRFLAEFGIEKPHEQPRWWLVSYWG
jgi:hypothetical protein